MKVKAPVYLDKKQYTRLRIKLLKQNKSFSGWVNEKINEELNENNPNILRKGAEGEAVA